VPFRIEAIRRDTLPGGGISRATLTLVEV